MWTPPRGGRGGDVAGAELSFEGEEPGDRVIEEAARVLRRALGADGLVVGGADTQQVRNPLQTRQRALHEY